MDTDQSKTPPAPGDAHPTAGSFAEPPPPGTRELMEVAPLIEQRRRRLPRFVKWAVFAIGLGVLFTALGLWLMNRRGVQRAEASRALLSSDGVVADARPFERGDSSSDRAALFVHGFASSPRDFGGLPDALAARGWFVRALLLPGHGRTAFDLKSTTNADLAAAVRAAHARLATEYETTVAVGFSMGAALVTQLAADVDLDAVALVAPYFGVNNPSWTILPAATWTRIASPLLHYLPVDERTICLNNRERAVEMFKYDVFPTASVLELTALGKLVSRPELLTRVTEDVLFVVSNHDRAADPEAARRAFAKISSEHSELIEVDASNHVLMLDYDADRVQSAVLDFFEARVE